MIQLDEDIFCISDASNSVRSDPKTMKCLVLLATFSFIAAVQSTVIYTNNEIEGNFGAVRPYAENFRRRCPLCDSSVYGYCSDKLFHDSCCCHNPNNPYDRLPYQCQFADCSFLHANSCQEHKLITACCCTNHLFKK